MIRRIRCLTTSLGCQVILRRHELLQRVNAVGFNHQESIATGVRDVAKNLMKLRQIEYPVLYAAEIAVPQQIVLFVCVEWTGEHGAHNGFAVC